MDDQILYCRDCGREFTFTVGEQEFYARHELANFPSRCLDCRTARKPGGGSKSQSNNSRTLYPTICANCGKATQVPFQPRSGGRPVYCSTCYQFQPRNIQFQRSRW